MGGTSQSNTCKGNSSSTNKILNSEGLNVRRYVCSILSKRNLITKFCIHLFPFSKERTASAAGPALANVEAEEAEEAIPAQAFFGSPPAQDNMEVPLEELMERQLSVGNAFTHYDFNER
jgi:hypothetical protein